MAKTLHYHKDYGHEHENGDMPHEHDLTTKQLDRIEKLPEEEQEVILEESIVESEDNPLDELTAETLDDDMTTTFNEAFEDIDESRIDTTLRKEANDALSKSLRKDAKARQEAIDAVNTIEASAVPGAPPEMSLKAEKTLSDALRHKSQAQEMITQYQAIAGAITDGSVGDKFNDTDNEVIEISVEDMNIEEDSNPRAKKVKPEEDDKMLRKTNHRHGFRNRR